MENPNRQDPKFLRDRFPGLAQSPEAKQAAKRTEQRTGESVSVGYPVLDQYEARIQNYLDRFKEITERQDPKERESGINALKKVLISHYVVRVEDIPESYWQAQIRHLRERGESGDWQDLSEEEQLKIKKGHLAQAKEDQKGSLEEWIDYLTSEKSSFLPDYLKYWAFQGMLRLERYKKGDKEKNISGKFPERSTGKQRSVKMFPEVNDRALKFIADVNNARSENQGISFRYDIPGAAREAFEKSFNEKDFRSLYGWSQEHLPPISEEEMQTTEGRWITFEQNSDPKELTVTLQGKGSGWCIAGEQIAGQYLESGNLHVYYTRDRDGKFSIPRVVIVQRDDKVGEVRGIEWEENVDGYIKKTNIIGDKLKEIPSGEAFFETDRDMKTLAAIDKKISAGQTTLTRDDLIFLYEIERPIKYFGLQRDPRIDEIRKTRKPKEDAPIVFDCRSQEIAWGAEEISENTKAYVGEWNIEIFQKVRQYPNIRHIYESFPDKKIFRQTLKTDPTINSPEKAEKAAIDRNIYISDWGKGIQGKTKFSQESQTYDLVRFTVAQLGFPEGATTQEIYDKAEKLGLELCPAEVGPHLRLQYPGKEWMFIAMKQIIDRDGDPDVFFLDWYGDQLELRAYYAGPSSRWSSGRGFVFRFRKLET